MGSIGWRTHSRGKQQEDAGLEILLDCRMLAISDERASSPVSPVTDEANTNHMTEGVCHVANDLSSLTK